MPSRCPITLFKPGGDGEKPESVGECVDRLTGSVKVPLLLGEDLTLGQAIDREFYGWEEEGRQLLEIIERVRLLAGAALASPDEGQRLGLAQEIMVVTEPWGE